MRLTESDYAALLARGTVREIVTEATRSLQVASSPPGRHEGSHEPEKRFLERVRRLAREHGWSCFHCHRSDKSEPGWPDLALCRETLVLVELKTNTGKLTREQQQWLSLLAHAGAETHVWKPHMWAEIVDRLTRKVHHADAGQP
jgi:hypothetical protein